MSEQPANPTANEPARYCRQCGYELRGLTTPRCPECGRPFDPADPKTFSRRPICWWHWYIKRAALALLMIVVLLEVAWGWFYWGWHDEERALAALNTTIATEDYWPIVSPWLRRHSGPYGFVLDRVKRIILYGNIGVTDLSPLSKLKTLETLFGETPVKDVSCLARLTNLKSVTLVRAKVPDLLPFAGLTNLETLSLDGAPIKDLSPLAGLTKLEELSLYDTLVEDPSPLASLKALRGLYLPKKTITDAQVKELKRALPDCYIRRG